MASILQWIDMDRYSRSLRVDSGDGVEEHAIPKSKRHTQCAILSIPILNIEEDLMFTLLMHSAV